MRSKVRSIGGGSFDLQPGKRMLEVRPGSRNKGTAITDFMGEAPFTGRRPVFVGDDKSDEFGFAVVDSMGGSSISSDPAAPALGIELYHEVQGQVLEGGRFSSEIIFQGLDDPTPFLDDRGIFRWRGRGSTSGFGLIAGEFQFFQAGLRERENYRSQGGLDGNLVHYRAGGIFGFGGHDGFSRFVFHDTG